MKDEPGLLVYVKNWLAKIKKDLDKLDTVNNEYEKELLIGSRNEMQALLDVIGEEVFTLTKERDKQIKEEIKHNGQ